CLGGSCGPQRAASTSVARPPCGSTKHELEIKGIFVAAGARTKGLAGCRELESRRMRPARGQPPSPVTGREVPVVKKKARAPSAGKARRTYGRDRVSSSAEPLIGVREAAAYITKALDPQGVTARIDQAGPPAALSDDELRAFWSLLRASGVRD